MTLQSYQHMRQRSPEQFPIEKIVCLLKGSILGLGDGFGRLCDGSFHGGFLPNKASLYLYRTIQSHLLQATFRSNCEYKGALPPCISPGIFRFHAKAGCCKLRSGQPEDRATQGCDLSAELEAGAGSGGYQKPSAPLKEKLPMDPKKDLKPCPFCGSNIVHTRATIVLGTWVTIVECSTCPAQMQSDTHDAAISRWNARAYDFTVQRMNNHLKQVIVHALHCEIIGTSIPTRNSCVMRVALHLSWACRAFHDSDPRPKHYGGASVHDVASAKRAGLQVLFGVHWKFFFEWSGRFLIPSATSPGLDRKSVVCGK